MQKAVENSLRDPLGAVSVELTKCRARAVAECDGTKESFKSLFEVSTREIKGLSVENVRVDMEVTDQFGLPWDIGAAAGSILETPGDNGYTLSDRRLGPNGAQGFPLDRWRIPVGVGTVYDISKLQNTSSFRNGALSHILKGDVKANGRVSGYHYEGMPNANAKIVAGTESVPNSQGVYTADVVNKKGHEGSSSFFPKSMTPQQIVNSVNEAYASKQFVIGSRNMYRGVSSTGMRIEMYIDPNGKIISAFPKY